MNVILTSVTNVTVIIVKILTYTKLTKKKKKINSLFITLYVRNAFPEQ